MSTSVYHIDQNVIIVLGENNNEGVQIPDKESQQKSVRKLNKEKFKVILQISGCKTSHSLSLTEKIFEHIFSRLIGQEKYELGQKKTHSQEVEENFQFKPQRQNVVQVSDSYLKDVVISYVCEKEYMKDKRNEYLEDFSLAWRLSEHREPLIILLGGTSGTGKSTVSSILASRFGVSTVLSTDSIRHIIRNFVSKDDNAVLFASTYEAGKYIQDEQLSENRRIIKGYKMQCKLVQIQLERVIERFQRINDTIIIEGVHLTPYFMLKVMKQFKRVLPFALCINKESKHKERFAVRSKYMTLDPGNNKYIENFPRIRLIQKWFIEKADEYLIPKVDNANIDKSIELIHKTIIAYLKKIELNPDQLGEMKNALPIYEEFTKINKSIWTSKELKDYINCRVNKNEIYENFLSKISESNNPENLINNQPSQEEKKNEQILLPAQNLTKTKISQKELLQQSVQKFIEINSKNEMGHLDQQNSNLKLGEGNFIVEGVNLVAGEIHHLSDDEDQMRRQFIQEEDDSKILKKAKSLKQFQMSDDKKDESPLDKLKIENTIIQTHSVSLSESPQMEQKLIRVAHSFPDENKQVELTVNKKKLVSFIATEPKQPHIQLKKLIEEEEVTPQKIDYKGILQHLSKHKRLFLSKKTKQQSLIFIKKMIQNYNNKYRSKHINDRIRLIQNSDESYCLYKTTLSIQRSKKLTKEDIIEHQQDHSCSDEESEGISSLAPGGKSLITANFPFSEKREISDGDDSVHFQQDQDQDSDNEPLEDNINSVEASDSSNENEDEARLFIGDEDDSFELHKINEEDEFLDEFSNKLDGEPSFNFHDQDQQ